MGGRPKGLATLIREMTRNGQDLVEGMLAIWHGEPLKDRTGRKRGRTPRVSDRLEAGKWLADRGWGRVPLSDGEGPGPQIIELILKPGQDY